MAEKNGSHKEIIFNKVFIKKGKLFYLYGLELVTFSRIKEYLSKVLVSIKFSLDRQGTDVLADGVCMPFKTVNFEKPPKSTNYGFQVLNSGPMPVFCYYKKRSGSFYLVGRAGLSKDERMMEV